MQSQIIGLGGGGFSAGDTPLLDLYILAASPKKDPKICLLPTASGDNPGLIEYFQGVFKQYPCEPRYLTLMSPEISNMEKFLLDSDIIYISGGNTKSMLGLWREWGIDKILIQAYNQGTVLAGVSAGFVCWFEQCISDSYPRKLTTINCLGLLKGGSSPHYGNERRKAFHRAIRKSEIKPGYAADDGVGLHFINGKLHRVISSDVDASAYELCQAEDGSVLEKKIVPEYLGSEDNFNKYIAPLFSTTDTEQDQQEVSII